MSIIGLAVLLLFTACKKHGQGKTPPETISNIRPVGTPVAEAWVETIGVEGGVVKSEDGRLEIGIPAGALSGDTEIGIQPLQHSAVSGLGYSYRLTPHGKAFKKKVTIRFHYEKEARRLASRQALEIAYQNEKGEWTCLGGATNDTTQKIISVQTDHFSDWGLIASMELTPVIRTVGLGEKVNLKAVLYVHPVNDDDLLIPLTIPDASSGVATQLDPKYIVKWTLNGPGKLDAKGSEAVFTAPSSKQDGNTATVTLELNVKGKQVLLISTIHIIDEGISISIDGGAWSTWPGMAITQSGLGYYGIASIRATPDVPQIVFQWPLRQGQRSDGVFGWSMLGEEANHVVFEYATPDLQRIYASVYDDGQDVFDSPGFMSVEEIEAGGKKYVTGVFAVDRAGLIDANTGEQVKISGIMGTFKVQRNW